jgi:hypothetical protein
VAAEHAEILLGKLSDHARHCDEHRPPFVHFPRFLDAHTDEEDHELAIDLCCHPAWHDGIV